MNTSKISFTPIDISNAFKSLKLGKACGVDGVSAEHFLYAYNVLHVLLSLLFTSFITHGYLPPDFMKTSLVPIIKNKTGDTSDKNNYRPIALVTAASKIFEICILELLEMYLITHDHQFGFKSKHSTDMCIFTVKSIDDLSDKLVKCKVGCYIDNLCMNHVMYADDICLMAPSPAALQELIDICYDFSVQNDLSFNSSKSYCMVFKPKSYQLSCPRFLCYVIHLRLTRIHSIATIVTFKYILSLDTLVFYGL